MMNRCIAASGENVPWQWIARIDRTKHTGHQAWFKTRIMSKDLHAIPSRYQLITVLAEKVFL